MKSPIIQAITISLLLAISTVGTAADNLYCAASSQYINVGMSLAEVGSACGKPLEQKKTRVMATTKIPTSQWFYRLGTSTGGRGNETFTTGGSNTGLLIVSFENDKVVSIKFDNTNAPSSSICNEGSIEQGNSKSEVSFACGEPNYTNETYREGRTNQAVEMVTWTIKASEYAAPTQLTFKNGTLESIGN